MNEALKKQVQALGLKHLAQNWDEICAAAMKQKPSYTAFLTNLLAQEYNQQQETNRLARIKKACIPELLVMQTFPFDQQPKLKKKLVLELYDSSRYLTEKQELVFIGPTGCGKTGLATAFLIHAINQGHRGYFIDFRKLLELLLRSKGDHTESKVVKRFQNYPILLIDEWGYDPVDKEVAGLLFDVLKRRHRKCTTLLTSQLGFDEWDTFLRNPHLTSALLDRITENCTLFNLKSCNSLRRKQIVYATEPQALPRTTKTE
jgi:DNA replication protein DnaC